MIRTTTVALSLALLLNACIPANPFLQSNDATPLPVNDQVTNTTRAATATVASATSTATKTSIAPSDTPEGTATLSDTAIAETQTQTQISDTLTAVQVTSAALTGTPQESSATQTTASSTATFAPSTNPEATETLYARFFGTMPPAIASGKIVLVNKSKVEVYISMQCTTPEGNISILEYPVQGSLRVPAPAGRYSYVAWVGGRQLLGSFGLGKNEERTITIYKDKVTIK